MKTILLIEDNEDVSNEIVEHFNAFFNFICFPNYSEVSVDLSKIDLILLDIKLKNNENGLFFAEQLKKSEMRYVPIITISGLNENSEIIHALKIGVNDYICKPLDMSLLFYKINNFLSLIEPQVKNETFLKIEDFYLIESESFIKYNNIKLKLTKKEYLILSLLIKNYSKPVSREKILSVINNGVVTTPRIVDTHVLNIRKKIPPEYKIVFENHVGYCLKKVCKNSP